MIYDLLARLRNGEHGSSLLDRLGGAQRVLEAGMPISSWVTAKINNEAAAWMREASDALDAQAKEIAELRKANAQLFAHGESMYATRNAAEARAAALEADAIRYRWLRDEEELRPRDVFELMWLMRDDRLNAGLDACVDAARGEA